MIVCVENRNHLELQNIQKNVMVNSMATSKNSTHFTIMYERKIREALEINKLKTINEKDKTFTVLNRDNGDYVTTNSWKPLFMKMGNH